MKWMKRKALFCPYQLSILSEKQNLRVLCCNLFSSQNQYYSYFTVSEHLLCCFLQYLWVVCLFASQVSHPHIPCFTFLHCSLLTNQSFNCVEEKDGSVSQLQWQRQQTNRSFSSNSVVFKPIIEDPKTDVSSKGFFFFFHVVTHCLLCFDNSTQQGHNLCLWLSCDYSSSAKKKTHVLFWLGDVALF